MEFGKYNLRNFYQANEKEFLTVNGIGGFTSLTAACANTRRYHGLLTASLAPPTERFLLLSNLNEIIGTDEGDISLLSAKAGGAVLDGYKYLEEFAFDVIPSFTYIVKDITIIKKILTVRGKNAVMVLYTITSPVNSISFSVFPLINCRGYHEMVNRDYLNFSMSQDKNMVCYTHNYTGISLCMESTEKFIKYDDCYFYGMTYDREIERGLGEKEDHFMPGKFEININAGETKNVCLSFYLQGDKPDGSFEAIYLTEKKRMEYIVKNSKAKSEFAKLLVKSSDAYIADRKSTNTKTVLAGYPWFTDWGRDALISLPGLCISTGRLDEAKSILLTFAKYERHGLLPNVFPDKGETPAYNSVDAPLWFFDAVYKYYIASKDTETIKRLMPVMKNIITAYIDGTDNNIKMDNDFLINAGNNESQLTWMDARVNGYTVTNRSGKPVEINALWYNAVRIYCEFLILSDSGSDKNDFLYIADNIKDSFRKKFYNKEGGYLYDVVNINYTDSSVRPNQIFAASLSFSVIDGYMAKKMLTKVLSELYTPYGLRSLTYKDQWFRPIYAGDSWERDTAYHQGTVWTWLLGHFYEACIKNGVLSKNDVLNMLKPLYHHMHDGCVGHIAEIFDAIEPFYPKGSFAQSWSVAEILRILKEVSGDVF